MKFCYRYVGKETIHRIDESSLEAAEAYARKYEYIYGDVEWVRPEDEEETAQKEAEINYWSRKANSGVDGTRYTSRE